MNCNEIVEKINTGVFRTIKKNTKSKIWKIFSLIQNENNEVINGFVHCENCNHLFKYNGKQTSNLIRHKCYVQQNSSPEFKQVSSLDKEEFINVCTQWIVEDCRPFSAVDGTGFRKLAQALISIGAKYGNNADLLDLIPDPTTISKRIEIKAEEKINDVKKEVQEAVTNEVASITTDLWTDNFVKRHFLCVTFHFMKESHLKQIVLGVKSMDYQSCTGEHILAKLQSVLDKFGVSNLDKIKFVTDRGSNIIKALQNYTRVNCSNHLFNNVLHSAFNNTEELQLMTESCRKLVKYFKKCNIQHMLTTSLKNYCVTRWNSHYNLFKSILNNWFTIQEILSKNGEMCRTEEIQFSTLTALVDLFEKFEKISRKLQGVNYVTSNYIYLSINTLKNICALKFTDSPAIANLKTNIISEINSKWIPNVSIYQYTACFLYPPTNRSLEEGVLRDVKNFCITQISSSQDCLPSPTSALHSETQPNSTTNESSDFQLFFSEFINTQTGTIEESVSDEVNRYSFCHINVDINFNVLEWWDHHVTEYPRLSQFAKKILAIPASSAASERVFSAAGNLITEKRNRLGPKSVNNILFLNSVYKYEHS